MKMMVASRMRNSLPPLGLLYWAGRPQQDHEVKVFDMAVLEQDLQNAILIVTNFQPDPVGITSIVTL